MNLGGPETAVYPENRLVKKDKSAGPRWPDLVVAQVTRSKRSDEPDA